MKINKEVPSTINKRIYKNKNRTTAKIYITLTNYIIIYQLTAIFCGPM